MLARGKRGYRFIEGGNPLLFLVCLVIFIDSAGYGVVVPVIPLYARKLGVGDFQLGFLFATYAIALLVGAIPMGMLSDRLGRRPFILFGMFAMAGAFVFYAMAQSYTTLVIARILDGLTAAATWSAGLALIGDRFDGKEMGAKFGYCMAAMAMGTVAGPLIGGVLSDAAGYRAPFFFIAAVCIAGGIGSMFLKENPAERYGSTATLKEMLAPILRNRVVMLACLVMLITTMGEGLLEPLLPLKLTDTFSLSATGIGIMFGVTMATHGLASPLIGKLSDRIGRKKLIALGLLTTAIVYPFLAVVKNLAVMYVLMGLIGITVALFAAPSLPLITDAMPTAAPGEGNLYGTAFGLTNLFWSLGYALGPLLGGAITGWAGLLTALSIYSALLVLLIFPVIKILE